MVCRLSQMADGLNIPRSMQEAKFAQVRVPAACGLCADRAR